MAIDLDNDPFLTLLTDALRAGPGSPEWREAVARLRDAGGSQADDYRLLIEARQDLESGKSYREIRAGIGFTRKIFSRIEQEPGPGKGGGFPTAGIIALIAAVVLIGVVAYVARLVASGQPLIHGAVDELANTYFANDVAWASAATTMPAGWQGIGALPLEAAGGLRAADDSNSGGEVTGGGLIVQAPMPGDQPFAVEATIRAGAPSILAEVFISTSPDFDPNRATAPHELVWLARGDQQQVVIDGRVEAQRDGPKAMRSEIPVRIVMSRDLAVIEVGRQRLWAGPHRLGNAPRYVGVRLVRTGHDSGKKGPVVLGVKVMK